MFEVEISTLNKSVSLTKIRREKRKEEEKVSSLNLFLSQIQDKQRALLTLFKAIDIKLNTSKKVLEQKYKRSKISKTSINRKKKKKRKKSQMTS